MSQYIPVARNILKVGNPLLRVPSIIVKNPLSSHVQQEIADTIHTINTNFRVGMHHCQLEPKLDLVELQPHKAYNMFAFGVPEVLHSRYAGFPKGPANPVKIYINPEIFPISTARMKVPQVCASLILEKDGKQEQYALKGEIWMLSKINIKYWDEKGDSQSEDLEGFKAIVAWHEWLHGHGILFTDFVKGGMSGLSTVSTNTPLLKLLEKNPEWYDTSAVKDLAATAGTRADEFAPPEYWHIDTTGHVHVAVEPSYSVG